MIPRSPFEVVRPLAWIAGLAFLTGFTAYALLSADSISRSISPLHRLSYADQAPLATKPPLRNPSSTLA